jgi:hypothetical protein
LGLQLGIGSFGLRGNEPVTATVDSSTLLIIATSAPPLRLAYRRDLLSCLGYPDGHRVSFTYRRKWIAEGVFGGNLKDRLALLVYSYEPADATSDKKGLGNRYSYVPLRFAKFDTLEPAVLVKSDNATPDTYFTASFYLGSFVDVNPVTLPSVRGFCEDAIRAHARPPAVPTAHLPWLFDLDTPWTVREAKDQEVAWAAIVEMLSHTESLQDCKFVQLGGLSRSAESPKAPGVPTVRPGPTRYVDAPVYALSSGENYRLVLTYLADPASETPKPTVSVTAGALEVSEPIFASVGQTRNATLLVRCKPVYADELSTVVVDHAGSAEGKAPRFMLLVKVEPRRVLRFLPIVLVLGFFLSSLIVSDFEDSWHPAVGLAKLLGAVMVGSGVWWGFRRLPGI